MQTRNFSELSQEQQAELKEDAGGIQGYHELKQAEKILGREKLIDKLKVHRLNQRIRAHGLAVECIDVLETVSANWEESDRGGFIETGAASLDQLLTKAESTPRTVSEALEVILSQKLLAEQLIETVSSEYVRETFVRSGNPDRSESAPSLLHTLQYVNRLRREPIKKSEAILKAMSSDGEIVTLSDIIPENPAEFDMYDDKHRITARGKSLLTRHGHNVEDEIGKLHEIKPTDDTFAVSLLRKAQLTNEKRTIEQALHTTGKKNAGLQKVLSASLHASLRTSPLIQQEVAEMNRWIRDDVMRNTRRLRGDEQRLIDGAANNIDRIQQIEQATEKAVGEGIWTTAMARLSRAPRLRMTRAEKLELKTKYSDEIVATQRTALNVPSDEEPEIYLDETIQGLNKLKETAVRGKRTIEIGNKYGLAVDTDKPITLQPRSNRHSAPLTVTSPPVYEILPASFTDAHIMVLGPETAPVEPAISEAEDEPVEPLPREPIAQQEEPSALDEAIDNRRAAEQWINSHLELYTRNWESVYREAIRELRAHYNAELQNIRNAATPEEAERRANELDEALKTKYQILEYMKSQEKFLRSTYAEAIALGELPIDVDYLIRRIGEADTMSEATEREHFIRRRLAVEGEHARILRTYGDSLKKHSEVNKRYRIILDNARNSAANPMTRTNVKQLLTELQSFERDSLMKLAELDAQPEKKTYRDFVIENWVQLHPILNNPTPEIEAILKELERYENNPNKPPTTTENAQILELHSRLKDVEIPIAEKLQPLIDSILNIEPDLSNRVQNILEAFRKKIISIEEAEQLLQQELAMKDDEFNIPDLLQTGGGDDDDWEKWKLSLFPSAVDSSNDSDEAQQITKETDVSQWYQENIPQLEQKWNKLYPEGVWFVKNEGKYDGWLTSIREASSVSEGEGIIEDFERILDVIQGDTDDLDKELKEFGVESPEETLENWLTIELPRLLDELETAHHDSINIMKSSPDPSGNESNLYEYWMQRIKEADTLERAQFRLDDFQLRLEKIPHEKEMIEQTHTALRDLFSRYDSIVPLIPEDIISDYMAAILPELLQNNQRSTLYETEFRQINLNIHGHFIRISSELVKTQNQPISYEIMHRFPNQYAELDAISTKLWDMLRTGTENPLTSIKNVEVLIHNYLTILQKAVEDEPIVLEEYKSTIRAKNEQLAQLVAGRTLTKDQRSWYEELQTVINETLEDRPRTVDFGRFTGINYTIDSIAVQIDKLIHDITGKDTDGETEGAIKDEEDLESIRQTIQSLKDEFYDEIDPEIIQANKLLIEKTFEEIKETAKTQDEVQQRVAALRNKLDNITALASEYVDGPSRRKSKKEKKPEKQEEKTQNSLAEEALFITFPQKYAHAINNLYPYALHYKERADQIGKLPQDKQQAALQQLESELEATNEQLAAKYYDEVVYQLRPTMLRYLPILLKTGWGSEDNYNANIERQIKRIMESSKPEDIHGRLEQFAKNVLTILKQDSEVVAAAESFINGNVGIYITWFKTKYADEYNQMLGNAIVPDSIELTIKNLQEAIIPIKVKEKETVTEMFVNQYPDIAAACEREEFPNPKIEKAYKILQQASPEEQYVDFAQLLQNLTHVVHEYTLSKKKANPEAAVTTPATIEQLEKTAVTPDFEATGTSLPDLVLTKDGTELSRIGEKSSTRVVFADGDSVIKVSPVPETAWQEAIASQLVPNDIRNLLVVPTEHGSFKIGPETFYYVKMPRLNTIGILNSEIETYAKQLEPFLGKGEMSYAGQWGKRADGSYAIFDYDDWRKKDTHKLKANEKTQIDVPNMVRAAYKRIGYSETLLIQRDMENGFNLLANELNKIYPDIRKQQAIRQFEQAQQAVDSIDWQQLERILDEIDINWRGGNQYFRVAARIKGEVDGGSPITKDQLSRVLLESILPVLNTHGLNEDTEIWQATVLAWQESFGNKTPDEVVAEVKKQMAEANPI